MSTSYTKGFRVKTIYSFRKPKFMKHAKEKLSFTVASFSVFAFIMGNMVGQHGWYAFWKTVVGKEDDSMIVFEGTVAPIAYVPDYVAWAKYGGNKAEHTFSQVPQNVLRKLPAYEQSKILAGTADPLSLQTYSTAWAGANKGGPGSHPAADIDAPRGTPVLGFANGVVQKVSMQNYGFGNYVLIRHPNVPDPDRPGSTMTLFSTYAHMDGVLVREGEVIRKGQQVGTVGNTGLVFGSTGYHLHFQIETADAPFHPYWPFTSQDAREAGLSYVQAVNSTRFQESLFKYTVNPMAMVAYYENYQPQIAQSGVVGITAQQATSAKSLTPVERLKLRSTARASTRQSRADVRASRRVAIQPAVTTMVYSPTVAEPTVTDSVVAGTNQDVYRVEITHDGSIGRTSKKVTIRAVDREGRLVETPTFAGKLYVRSEFGEAEIAPAELLASDFINGKATVNVIGKSQKTVILVTRGAFETMSTPMVFAR